MVQDGSMVKITDNAGGTLGKVFKVLGSSKRRYAGIGDVVVISVKIAQPRKGVKKKDVHHAVVVRTTNAFRRKDGSYIRFDDNAVVIIGKTSSVMNLSQDVFSDRFRESLVSEVTKRLFH